MRPGRAARPLAAKLIADGFDVVSLSRRPAESPHLVPGAVAHLAFDPADAGPWQDAIDGARAVVALGGAPFFRKWASWEEFERVGTGGRVVANRALVSAIERASRRPEVYVTASAVGYYGFIDSDEIITESSPAGPADRCTISRGGLRVSLTSLLWVKSLVVEAFSLSLSIRVPLVGLSQWTCGAVGRRCWVLTSSRGMSLDQVPVRENRRKARHGA